MLRKLFPTSSFRLIPIQTARNSTQTGAGAEISLNDYHEASNNKLEELSDHFETVLEDRYDKGADVSLSDGVLTVVVDEQNTFVINKQTPNRQIWLSSPISGPRRFDLVDDKWIDRSEKVELNSLISEELAKLLKSHRDI